MDTHPDITLATGDHVIFSAKTIPGNEIEVHRLVAALVSKGVEVTLSETSLQPIHASGHPCRDELQQMYDWIKPKIAIPVHGEALHMQCNADIAKSCGVPIQLTGSNGDVFDIVTGKILKERVPVGRLWLDDSKREALLAKVE
jgi:ribonuclease J